MGVESTDSLRRLTRQLMHDVESRSLGTCLERPFRDTFTLRPDLAKNGILTKGPAQKNFIRSEKGSLLFRNAGPTLFKAADARYPGRRMGHSTKGLEFRWTQLTSSIIRDLFALVESLAQHEQVLPSVAPEPTTEPLNVAQPRTPKRRSNNALPFEFHHNGVDQAKPLIYAWEIRDLADSLRYRYVGQSELGAERPLKRYARNVANLLTGRPYSRAKPDGFRVVHRRLAEAVKLRWPITLLLIRNVGPDENIFDVEAQYIREMAADDWAG